MASALSQPAEGSTAACHESQTASGSSSSSSERCREAHSYSCKSLGQPSRSHSRHRSHSRLKPYKVTLVILAAAWLTDLLLPASAQMAAGPSAQLGTPQLENVFGAAQAPAAAQQQADALAEQQLNNVTVNNITAALQWFNSPNVTAPDGSTTILHGIERAYGPGAVGKCREINKFIIKTANLALAALQISFTPHHAIEQYTNSTVTDFPEAKNFEAVDVFFSISITANVTLRAPLTADIVQLATAHITNGLRKEGLATGLLLLGVAVPGGLRDTEAVIATSTFASVLKVTGPNVLPFVVEKRTALLSTLYQLINATSPIGTINITRPGGMAYEDTSPDSLHPGRRRLLAAVAPARSIYIGMDMVIAPAGPTPMAVFGGLLGDGRYKTALAHIGLPLTLQWVNSTVGVWQLDSNGQVQFSTTIYPQPVADNGSSGHLPAGAIVGMAVGIAVVLILLLAVIILGVILWRRQRLQKRQQEHEKNGTKDDAAMGGFASKWAVVDSASSIEPILKGPKGAPTVGSMAGIPRFSSVSCTSRFAEITICKREDGSDWLLGSGSFGQVYKGLRRGVQHVAVKKLRPATSDQMWFSHLEREIEILSSVSFHRNVVQCLGACLEGDGPNAGCAMLVMEFLEGGDLRQAFCSDETGQYAWSEHGRGIALDIACGLEFLHSSGVIHRDLKTSNILLSADGVAKIADVGLAKTLGDATSWDKTAGTFAYAAPELILGVRCTEKADVFSFGVVLWEIVTMEMPIRGQLRDVQVPEECPQEIAELIDDCLQPNPAKRPSAEQLVQRIQVAPLGPKLLRNWSGGPSAHNIGRDNGQRSGDFSTGSVKSPGMIDGDALLASLYSS